jgi:catechol 2,3-dioxygenase-like lactoylglutathione lyase family enzyme
MTGHIFYLPSFFISLFFYRHTFNRFRMQITQIKETCLYIQDLELARDFYHQKLGFKVISMVEGRHVFFRAGSSVLLCFVPEKTKQEKTLPSHFAFGKQHIAFEVEQADYLEWKKKIQELGIEILHEQKWKNNLFSFYFHDPEGHVLEIVPKGIWD